MLIPARFNGPSASGNGGWVAGTFAAALGARAGSEAYRVTLRRPPPLETPLTVADGTLRAPDGTVVAEGEQVADVAPVVAPVPLDEAVRLSRSYAGFAFHPFPGCWVCGPERADGLRIFPGRAPDGRTAAPWTTGAEVDLATVWAALDCPGGWAVLTGDRTYVLGRITVAVTALPAPGTTCVVVGAATATDGRKATVESTLYGPDGAPPAGALATWVEIT